MKASAAALKIATSGAGTLLVGAGLAYVAWRFIIKPSAAAVGNAVNPASRTNLAYSGANAVGAAVTDDPHFSLGASIYDFLHTTPDPTGRGGG